MRIISGIFKGKKINLPKDIKTRPLKDLTKESIFNIIKHTSKFSIQIEESEVLDLFQEQVHLELSAYPEEQNT